MRSRATSSEAWIAKATLDRCTRGVLLPPAPPSGARPPMRAAAIQMTATADRDRNLDTADRLVRAAAADGAALIVLPEKWSAYGKPEVAVEAAEPLDGPVLTWA